MGNGGFLINNIAPGCLGISADSIASGYDVNSVLNGFVSDVFRSASSIVNIDIEMAEPVPFTAIAIINHNITEGSSINLRLSNTGFTAFDETINMSSNWYSRYIYKKDESGELIKTFASNLYTTFEEKTYKYIRVEIDSSLYVQIGEIFIGDVFQFTRNYNWGFGLVFTTDKNIENLNGQYIESQVSEQQGYKLEFDGVLPTEYEKFKHLFREGMKIFVPDMDLKECFHGIINSTTFEVRREYYTDNFTLNFMENF